MIICIDLTALADNFSGIERFTENIALNLIQENINDQFILIFKREIFKTFLPYKENRNVKIYILKEKNKLWFSQISLPLFLYSIQADKWLFMAFPSPLIFFRKGMISAIHDISCWDCPETMTITSKLFFRTLFRKSSIYDYKIITVSEFSKQRIQEKLHILENKISVIYNGINNSAYKYKTDKLEIKHIREKYTLPEHYILCLSTLEPRKNMRLLIDACCDLWKSKELKVNLVLAGRKGWKIENLLANVDDFSRNKIFISGFIDDQDLSTIYHHAEVFVFPSKYEGFGIPPLEALAAGTSVICSNSSSLPEILGNAVTYFNNNDLDDLKRKLIDFFKNNNKKTENLPRNYNWKLSAQKLYKENLLD